MPGFFDRLRYGLRTPRQSAQPYREQGVAGFVIMGGMVSSNETNYRLNGAERWRTAADMLSNVSIIAAGLRYTLNLTARPKWKLDPVNDTAEAKAAAEFAEDVIQNTDRSWSRIVRSTAMYRYHGFAINEWVASKRDDGKTGIQTVESRPQHTIEKWDLDANGGVIGVVQRDPQTGGEIYLPRKKIVYLVDDEFTDRPDGMGVFRHLVEDWNQLKVYMKLERMGFQRDLVGLPVGRIPLGEVNKMVADGRITAAQRDQMIEGIRDFVSMETKSDTTGLLLDSSAYTAKSDTGETISSVMKWGIDLITGEQNSVEALGAAIKRTQFDVALAMGVSSLLTGREGEGSRALSEDQSRNLYLTVNQSLKDMAEAFDRDIIGPLWAMNGLKDDLRPKLTTEDAAFKDVEQIAATLQKMAAAGAILAPDDPAINDLRNLMGISEAEEMSVEDLGLIRSAGKPDPNDEQSGGSGTGGGPGGGKPGNDNKPKDATTGAEQRRGSTAKAWIDTIEKYNPNHVQSGERGGEFTTGSGIGPGGGKLIPRKYQPRNLAELKDHPAVAMVDDGRPNDSLFVSLANGFEWSGQRSFGVERVSDALRLFREVEYVGVGAPPWEAAEALANIASEGRDTSMKFNPNHRPGGDEHGGEFTSSNAAPSTDSTGRRIAATNDGLKHFWDWYGDSVLVDEEGRPIPVYHGTRSEFSAFGRIDGGNAYGEGYYFATDPSKASDYATGENVNRVSLEGNAGPNVIPAYIKAENPLRVRQQLSRAQVNALEAADNALSPGRWQKGELWQTFDNAYKPIGDNVLSQLGNSGTEVIRRAGFDSLDTPYGWVVFSPTQIKSINNRGTFDPNQPDIVKFDPNQPRDPAGTPTGGQWTSTGGGVIMVKDKLGNEVPVTEDSSLAAYLVKNEDGTYSLDPEREKLHEEIVQHYLAGVSPATGAPEMYMTGGGPASGKSAILVGGNQIPGQHDAIHVDPDAIKNQIPEYREMFAAGDKNASSYVHEESSLVRRRLEAAARAGKYNVVLDTTGDSSVEKLAGNIEAYRAAGYRVNALYASLDTNLAVRLAHQRGLQTGRFVPESFLRETHRNVTNTFMAAAQERHLFDSVKLYDTNENGNPRLVATGDRSSFTINDRKLWDDFVAKGKGP